MRADGGKTTALMGRCPERPSEPPPNRSHEDPPFHGRDLTQCALLLIVFEGSRMTPLARKHDEAGGNSITANLVGTFRALYYHLYTNSPASRAERIIEDLSLLLLVKLAHESDPAIVDVDGFLAGHCGEEQLLIGLQRSYPSVRGQQFNLNNKTLRIALEDLSPVRLTEAPANVLGEAFQAVMGPRIRGDKGQFFTPRSLVRAMVRVIAPQAHESVLDPACGAGGFLMESHSFQSQGSGNHSCATLAGIDKDFDLSRLGHAFLTIATAGRAQVHNFNSLSPADWKESGLPSNGFDVILTNPPFGSKIGITDPELLARYQFGHHWINSPATGGWTATKALVGSQDPQTLFLELCIEKLRPGGRLGIVLPEGLFGNKRTGYVWDYVRSRGEIMGLLDCPRTTFQPGTDTKTNVLFFRKFEQPSDTVEPIRQTSVAIALSCGHDRRGRTLHQEGHRRADDFEKIGPDFHSDRKQSKYWKDVVLHNPYYYVPRYYEPESQVSAAEAELCAGAKVSTLRNLVEKEWLSVNKGHEVGSDAYATGDVPFVRTSDLANFEVNTDPTKAVSEEIYEQYAAQQNLRPGAILMAVDGRYRIGAVAMLNESNYRCIIQSHLRILVLSDAATLTPHELLFAFTLPSVRRRMRDLVYVQSTLGTLGNRLFELEVPLLNGSGPWRSRVDQFARILDERSRLLGELTMLGEQGTEL